MIVLAPCVRCGHGADEHQLEEAGITGTPMTANVEVVDTLLGETPRALLGTFPCAIDGCSCEDYVDEPLRGTRKRDAQS